MHSSNVLALSAVGVLQACTHVPQQNYRPARRRTGYARTCHGGFSNRTSSVHGMLTCGTNSMAFASVLRHCRSRVCGRNMPPHLLPHLKLVPVGCHCKVEDGRRLGLLRPVPVH
eukprot:350136-Chlamydomonas_euryale.AAC.11